jgi:hypothetical protein
MSDDTMTFMEHQDTQIPIQSIVCFAELFEKCLHLKLSVSMSRLLHLVLSRILHCYSNPLSSVPSVLGLRYIPSNCTVYCSLLTLPLETRVKELARVCAIGGI